MSLHEIIEGIKNSDPKFDPIQQYEIIKKFIEGKRELNKEDLDKLTAATTFDNTWCKRFEDEDCRGPPVYEFEDWGCLDDPSHPLYSAVDHVWYCIDALKTGDEEVSKQDLLNAVNDVIDYLKKVLF